MNKSNKSIAIHFVILFCCQFTLLKAQQLDSTFFSDDFNVSNTPASRNKMEGVFHGKMIKYTSTAERIPVYGTGNKLDAQIFYTSYVENTDSPNTRPITFAFNGGPGAATAWLHLGALGPRKIEFNSDGSTLPPPAKMIHNPASPLDVTDLVFIDAPGTGYSRVASKEVKKSLFNYDGDIEVAASFIKTYLDKYNRWGSPIYLFGESYGGTRVSGLSDLLIRRGVALNGVILLSPALNVNPPSIYNDMPYVLELPSMAAIASYHHKIDFSSKTEDISTLLKKVQSWAMTDYRNALLEGNQLSISKRKEIANQLSNFTGIDSNIILADNLRLTVEIFMKYLLADQQVVTGRVDGRLIGPNVSNKVEEPFYDPAMGSLTPAFASATQQYMINEIKYKSPIPYRMYSRDVAENWKMGGNPQPLAALQATAVKDHSFKVLAMNGIYDLAVPFWETEFYLDQMSMPVSFANNITKVRLPAGHMAYTDAKAMEIFSKALVSFYKQSK